MVWALFGSIDSFVSGCMVKKIVLAFDSFKGSLGSDEILPVVERVIRNMLPACEVLSYPIADGGEGTTAAICSKLGMRRVCCEVHDPLMRPVKAEYAMSEDEKTAVLELAAASGLPLVPIERRNPLYTTTLGTGEMIRDALDRGCNRVILGLGGSATNDAGMGLLSALGVRFLDRNENELEPCGNSLQYVWRIDDSRLYPALHDVCFTLACDVSNPFAGLQGAAFVYAPQKGADSEQVALLDKGLRHYADVLFSHFGVDIRNVAGAGAAGGVAGGLIPFLQVELKSGVDTILDILQFRQALQGVDLVLTGEGKIDEQTGMGKALSGILREAKLFGVPVIALGGSVEAIEFLNAMGFTAVFSIQTEPVSLEKAMQKEFALANLSSVVVQILRIIQCFGSGKM